MTNQVTILKNRTKPITQDYEQLRLLGLQYILGFSKDIWTDYNVHDPGITIMEMLNYVITDLAYRTSLPVEDILARSTIDTTKDFFTAREILTCNPVTFDDLRKKIIDVEGVENAWVLPYTDEACSPVINNPAYYISCKTTQPISISLNAEPQQDYEKRNINGLYKFNLLLEEDAVLGDLNILSVDWEMRSVSGVRKASIRFIFPLDMEKTYPAKGGALNVTKIEMLSTGTIDDYAITNFDAAKNTFDLVLICSTGIVIIEQVVFHIRPVHTNEKLSDLKTSMEAYLKPTSPPLTPAQLNASKAEVIAKIFSIFGAKVKKVSAIIDEVYCMYHHIRNLCEDVIKIGLVPSQEIAICADIETDNAVDLEDILGKIYFYIDTFFSPPVKFYLLKEMLDKGLPVESIFEGPVLKHGFILDSELQKKSLFTEVHVSDLYNIIMSIEGVKTIKYLQLTNYYNGIPKTEGEFWKLDLNNGMPITRAYHLNLDRLRSKIIFYKGDIPITADKQVANRIYNDLKATLSKPKINPALNILNNILPPVGTNYQLEEYYSVQNEFPLVYGINRDGIPSDADIIRKTKIKQLKGYLLFFDQLLANYLSQLAQLKNLYAVGNENNQTYFSQPVYDTPIPQLEDDNFYSNPPLNAVMPDSETLNFYGIAPLLKDFPMPTNAVIDEPDTFATVWNPFTNDKKNLYRENLKELVEPEDDTLHRRNRFLDHLLARFAENFSDYAAMMYKFTGNVLESSDKKTAVEIADDKVAFLKTYHILSYNRGRGQYYKCCPSGNCEIPPVAPAILSIDETLEYDTYNIPSPSNPTGLHERATLMLGMNINDNQDLVESKFMVIPSGTKFKFVVQYDSTHVLTSVNKYDTEEEAFDAMELMAMLITDEDNPNTDNLYFEAKPFGGGFRIEVKETLAAVTPYAVSSPLYTTMAYTLARIKKLKEIFFDEGMHIIDHLLLRPLPVNDLITDADLTEGFFPLCAALNPDCDCPITDYYSFRISVVLPYWTERFRNMDFRAFAEDTIHRETPAHILPKFCWVNMYDMHRLENAYTIWFAENKKYKPNMNSLKAKLKDLIKVINTLSNVYPEGYLHDCDNPSTDNPVILNQTNLGTF